MQYRFLRAAVHPPVCSIFRRLGHLLLVVFCAAGSLRGETIASVSVRGTQHDLALETRPGVEFDRRVVTRDVRRLWKTGRFGDVRVVSGTGLGGLEVTFEVVERPRLTLRSVRFDPPRERRNVKISTGSLITQNTANAVAQDLERSLVAQGFPAARVEARVVPVDSAQADLEIRVNREQRTRVAEVSFAGHLGLPRPKLAGALRATRPRHWIAGIPGLWKGWRRLAPYSTDRVDADLAALRSLYIAEGFFEASVAVEDVSVEGARAQIRIHADSDRRYRVEHARVETPQEGIALAPPGGKNLLAELCECLLEQRRQAHKEGRLDFKAQLDWETLPSSPSNTESSAPAAEVAQAELASSFAQPRLRTTVTARVDPGPRYRLGRLEFRGDHKLSDSTLRRAFTIDEGELLDLQALKRSLDRLNGTGLVEPVRENDVEARWAEESVDLIVSVRKAGWGRWSVSGPLGPVRLFGPLRFSIESRLPPWGRDLLELSTYFATFGVLSYSDPITAILTGNKRSVWRPFVAVRRPLLPGDWASGLLVSPSLAWEESLLYAGAARSHAALARILASAHDASPLKIAVRETGSETASSGILLCRPKPSRLDRFRSGARLALSLVGGLM